MVYLVLSTLVFVLGLGIIHWIHAQDRMEIVVDAAVPPENPPLISLCIPARNEEKTIRACVRAALSQDYPNLEVIVLDDRSDDSTRAQIQDLAAADPRLILLDGRELPEGWAGKPHALHQAAAAARGTWLCFVDADTTLAPEALTACLAGALTTQADLFTTMNRQILESFWEKAVMPLVLTALSVGFPPRRVNDPSRRDAVANGQFILIRRAVYEAIGGHAAVRDRIVEDKALAERVKWSGRRLVLADGSRFIRTRMYTSLPEMWEGWTKNIYLGLQDRPGLLMLGAFGASLALMAALFLPAWPLLGIGWAMQGGSWMAWLVTLESLLLWGTLLVRRMEAAGRLGIRRGFALTTPLGAAVFAAMMLTSAWKVLSGRGVSWRGRHYHPSGRVST